MISLSKSTLTGLCACAALLLVSNPASAAFVSYTIRGTPTVLEDSPGAGTTTFGIAASGDKAALGSSAIDGHKLSDIAQLGITRVDDYTRFAAGSGPRVGPYLNFWITDGAGNYAVAANEPSNAEWSADFEANGGEYLFDWDYLKTKSVKIYENTDKSWLPSLGLGLTFADLAEYVIEAPSVADLTLGWAGLAGGAPRELGTNLAFGVNWVFGDTLSNYVSGGDPGYQVRDAVVAARSTVPEPGSLALVGAAMVGLVAMRRRKTT